MDRRNFNSIITLAPILGAVSAKLAFSETKNRITPKKLKAGDKVSVIAPGTAVSDPADYYRSDEILQMLELKPVYCENVKKGSGYKTRSIEERVDDIHQAFSDSSTKAVFCIRGGYGSGSILPYLNYKLIENNPKIFCGYSDITALHLAFNNKTDLVTYHGPVLLSNFNDYTLESFKNVLFKDYTKLELSNPVDNSGRNDFPIITIKEGIAEGELVGGNLSLITSLLGTEYEIKTDNRILFFEDVGEEPYRIHRMITQLKLAGKLDYLKGLVIGKCKDCKRSTGNTWDQSELEVYQEILNDFKYLIIYGIMLGHTKHQITLPIGSTATINTKNGTIILK